MDIKNLSTNLKVENIDFMPKSLFSYSGKTFAQILAYKDARVDMETLDAVVGKMNWQNSYVRDSKGTLQCGIGIWDDEKKYWVWKFSNGTASDFESVKGEYSDAFKRAGFMWGIGRGLYDFPKTIVELKEGEFKDGGGKPVGTSKLQPNSWQWKVSEDYKHVEAYQFTKEGSVLRFKNAGSFNSPPEKPNNASNEQKTSTERKY